MAGLAPGAGDVLHWYDFVCPFCYLAQPDNEALVARGIAVMELAFLAHPEIPPGGLPIDPRGPRFEMIARLAAERDMPLRWSDRLPDTRTALAAAEWVRLNQPEAAAAFRRALFAANFVAADDIGDRAVVLAHAAATGVEIDPLRRAIEDGSADAAREEATLLGRAHGVRGTPAWSVHGTLIEGLQPGGPLAVLDQAS